MGGATDEAVGNKERLLYCILKAGDCPRWVIKKILNMLTSSKKRAPRGWELSAEVCLIFFLNLQFLLIKTYVLYNVQCILNCRHYQKSQMHIILLRKGEVQSNSWKYWNFSSKFRQLTEWNRIAGFQRSKKSHHSCIAISNDNIYDFEHTYYSLHRIFGWELENIIEKCTYEG